MSNPILPNHPQRPHRAVLFIQAEVHELNNYGECVRPVHKIQQFPLYLDGPDRDATIMKLNELLAELKDKCKNATTKKNP